MITVAKATNVEYYTSSAGVASGMESYYLDAVTEGEPAGVWLGSGAAGLGLAGEVDAEDMKTLYGQFVNPVTGEQFGARPANRRSVQERLEAKLAAEPDASPERIEELRAQTRVQSNVIGWDATFSVPKSVTAVHTAAHRGELAAIRSGDVDRAQQFAFVRTQIEDAIAEANGAGIEAAERVATSRMAGGPGGATQWVGTQGLTVASFFQHTNRSIDPHLHVHNVILNRVMCEDGKVRSLDGEDLLEQRFAFSATADRVLSESLTSRLGLQMRDRPDGTGREVAVVPQEVIDHFSTRSRQTTAAMAPLVAEAQERLGRELTAAELFQVHRAAGRSSRAAKTHQGESAAELNERWWAELLTQTGHDLDSLGQRIYDVTTAHTTTSTEGEPQVPVRWSADAVISAAVAACSEREATWGRANLISELELHLPILGISAEDVPDVLEALADEALARLDVVQVTGIGTDIYAAPSATKYASAGTLAAEGALRRATIERGAASLPREQVAAWLDEHYPSIGADQRAAVEGITSSDAAVTILVGPAGTGKSFAAGALAGAWQDLTLTATDHGPGPGRVVGLADSDAATRVLIEDGIPTSRNIAQWLGIQARISSGSTRAADIEWRLGPADVVMVDEASMVATTDLERIHALTKAAGARLVLTGDPRQLAAVEAGGVMDLLAGRAETYTLTDVRRFTNEWERAASLNLRDGDAAALGEYDRHGRLIAHPTLEDATAAAARAAVADRLDGRSVVVVAATNAQAAAVAAQVRDQLISLGVVHPGGGVITGRDQNTASIGDVITCRHNDRTGLGVTNQVQYTVLDTATSHPTTDTSSTDTSSTDKSGTDRSGTDGVGAVDEGWLLVREVTGPDRPAAPAIRLPGSYVGEHVQLGYASTVHSAQGLTVDSAHLLAGGGGRLDAATVYVAMTRGRERNTAHVALNAPTDTASAPSAGTAGGGQVRFEDTRTRAHARDVLQAAMNAESSPRAHLPSRGGEGISATVAAERAAALEASMVTISARLDAETRHACRARTERHLDDLVAAGTLDENTRARLGADQGTEHLSRLLRVAEQAGHDPRDVLTDALSDPRGLGDTQSVAQVLSHRITRDRPPLHPLEHPHEAGAALIPAGISDTDRQRLNSLHQRAAARTTHLGHDTAQQAPAWAVQVLGPVPDTTAAADRADWQQRAGIIAAHREAVGFDHPTQALDRMPGLSATERRGSFAAAWSAAGRPEPDLDVNIMSDGQIRNRLTAWQREQQWAPPFVDHQLRDAETAAETARHNAVLAEAAADLAQHAGNLTEAAQQQADAARHRDEAAFKAAAAREYTQAAEARSQWAAATIGTRQAAEHVQPEAERRDLRPGQEADRSTTHDWMAEHQAHEAAADAYRTISEADIATVSENDTAWAAATYQDTAGADTPGPVLTRHGATNQKALPEAVHDDSAASTEGSPEYTMLELETMIAATNMATARMADRHSQDSNHDQDEQETAAIESFEAGRRRREAAELDSAAANAARTMEQANTAGIGND